MVEDSLCYATGVSKCIGSVHDSLRQTCGAGRKYDPNNLISNSRSLSKLYNFLENRFIDKIETKNINYSIQEVNRNVNRRVKTYKVCAEYKGN